MKKVFVTFALLFLPLMCAAQTYTTTQDACGTKITPMFCSLPTDGGTVTLDNRAPSRLGYLELPNGTWFHGEYTHFIANPDGSQNDFSDAGFYLSDDKKVEGAFNYHAHYVKTCSGRACGGTLGWHYTIKAGSTVTVGQ